MNAKRLARIMRDCLDQPSLVSADAVALELIPSHPIEATLAECAAVSLRLGLLLHGYAYADPPDAGEYVNVAARLAVTLNINTGPIYPTADHNPLPQARDILLITGGRLLHAATLTGDAGRTARRARRAPHGLRQARNRLRSR